MTKDEGMEINNETLMTDDEGMTRLRAATARQAKFGNPKARAEDSFWGVNSNAVLREEPEPERVYDLEERTARFGQAVIDLARAIPQDAVTNRIINQLVGVGTSVGANYVEADDAVSKKEFLKSIGTCKKETREVKHFLRRAVPAVPSLKPTARKLWLEARKLHLIFSKIWRSAKNE